MEILTEFEKKLKARGLQFATIRYYLKDANYFVEWYSSTFGKTVSDAISLSEVNMYIHYITNLSSTQSVLRRRLFILKTFLKYLGGICVDHIKNITLPKVIRKAGKYKNIMINNDAIIKLEKAVFENGNKRDIAILTLLINTGIRAGEAINLRLEDVHLSTSENDYSYIEVVDTKSVMGQSLSRGRRLYLDKLTEKVMSEYIKDRIEASDGNLFIGQRGPVTAG